MFYLAEKALMNFSRYSFWGQELFPLFPEPRCASQRHKTVLPACPKF